MTLEKLFRGKSERKNEKIDEATDRITRLFFSLPNKNETYIDDPSWGEINLKELQALSAPDLSFLSLEPVGYVNLVPRISAHTGNQETWVAIMMGSRRVRFLLKDLDLRFFYEEKIDGEWTVSYEQETKDWKAFEHIMSLGETIASPSFS